MLSNIGVHDFRAVSCYNQAEVVLTEGVGTIEIVIKQDGLVEANITEQFYVWIVIGPLYLDWAVVYIRDTSCEFVSVLTISLS